MTNNMFSIAITEPLQISVEDGFFKVSVKARGGSVEILGDMETFIPFSTGVPLSRSANVLEDGQGQVIQNAPQKPVVILITPIGAAIADVQLYYS